MELPPFPGAADTEALNLTLTRSIRIPDPVKVALTRRSPDLGPRILFFSGGTALRSLSRELIHYTHNSIHIITPFDSGGSSAQLRKAFHMPAIGDVRNRLMALADQSLHGFPGIYRLFAHRLSKEAPAAELAQELMAMVDGRHPLTKEIPDPMRKIIRHHLRSFRAHMPEDFDLRGASIGNLILTSGYLENERHLDPVIFIFSKLVQARGVVRPCTNRDLHLAAVLEDGRVIAGQHNMTGKETAPLNCRIRKVYLTRNLNDPVPAEEPIRNKMRTLIAQAELICYPMGSFYSSVIANLLPGGITEAVAANPCPKIFIPNTGTDPEQFGLTVTDQTRRLLGYLKSSLSDSVGIDKLLNFVLTDDGFSESPGRPDPVEMDRLGIRALSYPLITEQSRPNIDASRLAPVLVSLA